MRRFKTFLTRTGLALGLLTGWFVLTAQPVAAACSTPTPTTAAGYEQLLRGPIAGKWYTGDSGQSVKLPNGKILWVFGDTLIGKVGETRATQATHNSALLTEKGCVTSVIGANNSSGNPTDWVKVPAHLDVPGVNDYYWASTPYMDGSYLYMFLSHMYNDASGFHQIGVDVAKFSVFNSKPSLVSISPTPGSAGYSQTPAWGTAVVRTSNYTYIYGGVNRHETWVFGQYYSVARVPNGQVTNKPAWRFWTGSQWSTSETAAQPVIPGTAGVGSGLSVYRRADGTYVLTSKKYDIVGKDIAAWTAPSPTGPWTETKTLLSPVPNVNSEAGELTYFGLAHPEIPLSSGKLLLSWSLNSSDPSFFGDPRYGLYLTEVDQP